MSIGSKEIYTAEQNRITGSKASLMVAVEDARKSSTLTRAQIELATPEELFDHMRKWRIWEVSAQSLASRQWNGNNAARFLFEARDVIQDFYYNPKVWEQAIATKTDPENHEYYMAAEMSVDEGRYFQKVYTLTGDADFLRKALASFQQAEGLAKPHSSVAALAVMHQQSIFRYLEPNRYDLSTVDVAFYDIFFLTSNTRNLDRRAAASWMFAREALAAWNLAMLGEALRILKRTSKEMQRSWTAYPLKSITGKVLDITQRGTFVATADTQFSLT